MEVGEAALSEMFASVWPHLNERQRRLVVGAQARALGRGGVSVTARAAGLSRPTVARAIGELELPGEVDSPVRARRPGGGRKRSVDKDPALPAALERLVDPATRGDPMSALRWTCKSTRTLARGSAAIVFQDIFSQRYIFGW